MKRQVKIFIAAVIILLPGCAKDVLDKYPLDQVSMVTYWKTENDLSSWVNSLYDMTSSSGKYRIQTNGYIFSNILQGNGVNRPYDGSHYNEKYRDFWSDNYASLDANAKPFMQIKTGTNFPPTSGWDLQEAAGWWWFLLRPINLFMENYERAEIPDETKYAYGGEVAMFRAWFYYDKVCYFGDVPLILKSLDITDTLALYGKRDPRVKVMAQVLKDINFACENLPDAWPNNEPGPGYMNKWAALALKARICLFEGTWRKYHQTGQDDVMTPDMWLREAADAAKQIIDNGKYSLYSTGDPLTDYRYSYAQNDLSTDPEIIYWKRYVDGLNPTTMVTDITLSQGGATRSAIEDYLCTDGLPIGQSPLYMGDDSIETVFMNRDPRLRQTVLHPDDTGPDKPLYFSTGDTKPYPRLQGMAGGVTNNTGYEVIKYYQDYGYTNWSHDETAAIIFGYNEVLLNYAEAKAELGECDQSVLDMTINKLRDRVAMPHLVIGSIVHDPVHADEGVSDLLVEIRRERRVELFGDGFRYDDLRRWHTFVTECSKPSSYEGLKWDDNAISRYVGAKVKSSVDAISGETYIDVFKGTGFENINLQEKHYLWPLPVYVLSDNPNLGQNPGW